MRVAFGKHECFSAEEGYRVPLALINTVTGNRATVSSTIDTGFDGSIMVDSGTYANLKLEVSERPEDQFPAYRTLLGTILFKSSIGQALIAGKDLDVEIVTPLHGTGKILIGRRVLSEFTTLLHKSERCCVGEAQVEG